MAASDDGDQVLRLEEELLRAGGDHVRDGVEELLDRDFVELGASGRRWERAEVVSALAEREPPSDARMRRAEVTALAPDVLLLTYEAVVEGRGSLRSSAWLRTEQGWRLRFHQGTPIPGDEDE